MCKIKGKGIIVVTTIMMTTMNLNAQNGYDDTKNEVAISYGVGSNSLWIDFNEYATEVIFNGESNKKYIGAISVEYYYRVKNWLGLGGIFAYGHCTKDLLDHDDIKFGDGINTYLTLMPAAKFDWLRKNHFGLYSKVGLGATLRKETIDYKDDNKGNYGKSVLHLNWQTTLIGMEFGSPYVRGFYELGHGEQGLVSIGLRCKF